MWAALNDTGVLKRCIEGCESFERVGEQSYKAIVRAQVGPVNALFAANVALVEDPQLEPHIQNFRLVIELERAPAGFGRGEAKLQLTEESATETMLGYEINAVVGGKLAQIGSRLMESAARSMASSFFGNLQKELGGGASEQSTARKQQGSSSKIWWMAATGAFLGLLAVAIVL